MVIWTTCSPSLGTHTQGPTTAPATVGLAGFLEVQIRSIPARGCPFTLGPGMQLTESRAIAFTGPRGTEEERLRPQLGPSLVTFWPLPGAVLAGWEHRDGGAAADTAKTSISCQAQLLSAGPEFQPLQCGLHQLSFKLLPLVLPLNLVATVTLFNANQTTLLLWSETTSFRVEIKVPAVTCITWPSSPEMTTSLFQPHSPPGCSCSGHPGGRLSFFEIVLLCCPGWSAVRWDFIMLARLISSDLPTSASQSADITGVIPVSHRAQPRADSCFSILYLLFPLPGTWCPHL
ncbi:hypothetical protein AAY473_030075 [Plecturocebus cupreus]